MTLPDDKKMLVLRYGTNIVSECIERHMDILNQYGFCWFAKLGKPLSQKSVDSFMVDKSGIVILYSKEQTYICKCIEAVKQKPESNYPQYYDELIFEKDLKPSLYLKLTSIEKMEPSELSKLYVCSSKSMLTETLHKSMNSFFIVVSVNYTSNSNKEGGSKTDAKKKAKANTHNCIYRDSGICNCKGFVNYQYECLRPSTCIRQKIR